MKKIAKFLINSIVDHPKKVIINQRGEKDLLTLSVKVSLDDIGKVIGRRGKTIKALTSLIRIKAIKEGKRVNLEIQESGE